MQTYSPALRQCSLKNDSERMKFARWLAAAAMAGILSGCGGFGSSSSETAATETASGEPADAGGPAVMASPAGGGVVLDDGLDSRGPAAGAPAPPVFMPSDGPDAVTAAPPPAAATPAAPALAAGAPEDDPNQVPVPAAGVPTTSADSFQVQPGAPPALPGFGIGASEQGGNAPFAAGAPVTATTPRDGGRRRKKGDDDNESLAPGEAPNPVFNPAAAPPAAAGIPGANMPLGGPTGFATGADGDEAFGPGFAGQPGQTGAIEIKRGSAEEVTTTFLALLAAGDMEQAVTLIGGRATGILAKLREGTASEEDIEQLQEAAASQDKSSRPKGGNRVQFSVRSEKTILLIEADQKEEGSSVVKLEMRDAPRKRGTR